MDRYYGATWFNEMEDNERKETHIRKVNNY